MNILDMSTSRIYSNFSFPRRKFHCFYWISIEWPSYKVTKDGTRYDWGSQSSIPKESFDKRKQLSEYKKTFWKIFEGAFLPSFRPKFGGFDWNFDQWPNSEVDDTSRQVLHLEAVYLHNLLILRLYYTYMLYILYRCSKLWLNILRLKV